ncbi:egl nine homolog 1-like [Hydractinia symbiolongicarpus]|uniref:egl nine homolog 1-like n=1 Tax=Hydractinia symbiolongicarpus TaxID=13093 RepID=UPI00254BBAE7|nr:egl nine homolog 1-like [Hydractinia symbiolongicarpus]
MSDNCIQYASVIRKARTEKIYRKFSPSNCTVNKNELHGDSGLLLGYVLKSLNNVGICIIDNFLTTELAKEVQHEAEELYAIPEKFRNAEEIVETKYRSDKVCWVVSSDDSNKKINSLRRAFDELIESVAKLINQTNNVRISHRSQTQISCFPPHSFGYKVHTDNPNNNGRLLTVCYYSNECYNNLTHGGFSRFYVPAKANFVDIEPIFNRAIIYWSDKRILKQVLPCRREVFSFTTWYFGAIHDTNSVKRSESSNDCIVKKRQLNVQERTRQEYKKHPKVSRGNVSVFSQART